MIYIIFTMAIIINIFNILLIANNKIYQNIKEKALLVTYSVAELIYLIFILSLIEYTAVNTVFVISFIGIWLLSKAYICVVNINLDDAKLKGCNVMEENNNLDKNVSEIGNKFENNGELSNELILDINEKEVESSQNLNNESIFEGEEIIDTNLKEIEVELNPETVEISNIIGSSVNNTHERVFIPNSFYELSNSNIKTDGEQQTKNTRRRLALKINRVSNNN